MNKKILMSLGVVVFVTALSMTATGAFFSDSETSTGNTFTAGAIDLKVDSTQHYNHMVCVLNTVTTEPTNDYYWQPEVGFIPGPNQFPVAGTACDGTWTLTDLGITNKFFNFSDVKPGDQGENTVSLHIDNNPAWACLNIKTTSNDENTHLTPETNAGDVTLGPVGNGELAGNLHFQAWLDQGITPGFQGGEVLETGEGDNIWQEGEPALASGVMSDLVGSGLTLTLADGGSGTPLAPLLTNYVGLFWCAGTVTGGAGSLGCDGSTMDNKSQTDSVTADVTFTVEQSRNNAAFRCVPQEVPLTGTVTLDKIVTFTDAPLAGVDPSDYTLHLVGPGGDHILVDQVAFPGLTPGAYTVSEVYSGNPANATSTAVFSGSCTEIGTTDTATLNVVAGVNPVCTITNSVTQIPS